MDNNSQEEATLKSIEEIPITAPAEDGEIIIKMIGMHPTELKKLRQTILSYLASSKARRKTGRSQAVGLSRKKKAKKVAKKRKPQIKTSAKKRR